MNWFFLVCRLFLCIMRINDNLILVMVTLFLRHVSYVIRSGYVWCSLSWPPMYVRGGGSLVRISFSFKWIFWSFLARWVGWFLDHWRWYR